MSKEGESFSVAVEVAKMSKLVEATIDDDDDDDGNDIMLPNVKASVLAKVIEYCQHYKKEEEMRPIQTPLKHSKLEELVQPWYVEFVDVEREMLFELVTAANFMDIKPLLDLTCLAVSIMIKVSALSDIGSSISGNSALSAGKISRGASSDVQNRQRIQPRGRSSGARGEQVG